VHGIEIKDGIEGDLLIDNCFIEDNFCNGLHISSEQWPQNI
jgi:hypothetical protein